MQTVCASVILEDAYRAIGWDPTQLEPLQEQMARNAFSLALQEVWESWWWESLMKVGVAQFAAEFSGTFTHEGGPQYPYGTAVYFSATDAYYINLAAAGPPALQIGETYNEYGYTNGDPADTVPVAAITFNPYGWAQYRSSPAVPPIWNNQMTPGPGDQCFWQGTIFQWTAPTGANGGNWQPNPAFNTPGGLVVVGWTPVPAWQPTVPYTALAPDPTDPFELASLFTGPSGPIHTISQLDPRITPGGLRYHTRTADDASGTVALGLNLGRPWIAARRVTPIVTGDDFDATVVYTATAPQDLVSDS